VVLRLDKLRADPARDAAAPGRAAPAGAALLRRVAELKGAAHARLDEYRWLLEELRVSLFAQECARRSRCRVKRLDKAWAWPRRWWPTRAGRPACRGWPRSLPGCMRHRAGSRSAHVFRIDTTDGIGRPTPEGAHRDGVDLVAVFLVGRHNVKGGETRVFDIRGPQGVRFTLGEPWSVLLLDDARVIHESTPIQPWTRRCRPWRDTLVVTLRRDGFQGPLMAGYASHDDQTSPSTLPTSPPPPAACAAWPTARRCAPRAPPTNAPAPGVLQVRELPAHGRLQVPRRLQRAGALHARAAPRRRDRLFLGQPCAGHRAVGAAAGHALGDRDAAGRAGAKLAATRGYQQGQAGSEVVLYDRYTEDREAIGRRIAAERGMTLIPPYDHPT
jgi:hypothetical protein